MEQMPIPLSNVIMFGVALILTTIVPILVLLILCIKKKLNWMSMLLGFAAFFLSQIILRIPILSVLSTQSWFVNFTNNFYIIYVIFIGGFTAGLFEESARFGGAKLLKDRTTYKDAISFGLGHAICEVILINGMTNVNNVLYCLLINSGNTAAIEQIAGQVTPVLAGATPIMIGISLFERIASIIFHVFATLLVFKGVNDKKISYYFYAILAHTITNASLVLVSRYVNAYVGEALFGVYAIFMLIFIIKCKSNFRINQNSVVR